MIVPTHPPRTRSQRLLVSGLRLFFRLLYHEMAWTYDLVAATVSLGRWKSWVLALLPSLTGTRILELGHGPGHLQVSLHQAGRQVFGLDASPQMGRQAFKRIQKQGFVPSVVNGYAQLMPFPNRSFDQIVATFPTEYIVAPETLSEILRLLRPGGEVLILPVAWITGNSLPDRLAAGLFQITHQSPPPEHTPLRQEAAAALQAAGFVHARTELIELESSRLLLVRATRPPDIP